MLGLLGSVPIVVILVAGVCAPLAGWMAMQRARNPAIWFVYGALTGPIAILLLYAAPPGRCPECDQAVDGWATACRECGAPFETLGARLGRPAAADPPRAATAVAATRPGPTPGPPAPTAARAPVPTSSLAPSSPVPSSQARPPSGMAPQPARAGAAPRPPLAVSRPPVSIASSEVVLATGIYLSGNTGMEIGALYAIARVEDRIRIFGPVDAGQQTVRLDRPLADTEVGAIEDRIVISSRHGRSTTSVVMRAVGGKRAADLEAALAVGPEAGTPDRNGR